jgi:hypothetical protein
MIKYAGFAIALFATVPAQASWLEDAWADETVRRTGGPSITLSARGVDLVLPADTLSAARAEGVGAKDAAALFIARYGQHCATTIDLDQQQKLQVRLFVSKPVELNAASEAIQQEIGDTLARLAKKTAQRPPHVRNLFVTEAGHSDFVLDYVPERKASCVSPGAGDKIS